MGSIRNRLRRATHTHHQRVDELARGFDLSTREGYSSLVGLHASIVLPAERLLNAFRIQRFLRDWPERSRAEALLADADELGVGLDDAVAFPAGCTFGEAIGILYVLEGSRLGSQFLLSQLEDRSDYSNRLPTRFLRHGEKERMWPSFVLWLDRQRLISGQLEEAETAAAAVFTRYEAGVKSALAKG